MAQAILATVILGLLAGGVAGVLFVTAQPDPGSTVWPPQQTLNLMHVGRYPFAVGVGFTAGLTADTVLGKLLGLNVVRTSGIDAGPQQT